MVKEGPMMDKDLTSVNEKAKVWLITLRVVIIVTSVRLGHYTVYGN